MLTLMNVTDQYPSTYDMPPIGGAQDSVLAILEKARKRYKRGATPDQYLTRGTGQVCALGAVAAAAGFTAKQYEADGDAELGGGTSLFASTLKRAGVEEELIAATKEAIKLLNQAAIKLYPVSRNYGRTWSGPLEWVNQEFSADFRDSKKAVLACYDKAIADRTAG